jgi:Putative peptidoglycan binding domain
MQAIHPTLASGQQGTDIANLHVVLDKFGFGGPVTERERTDQRFGEGTAEAVRRLQSQFAIPARQPWVVDEQTAGVMNQRLFEMDYDRSLYARPGEGVLQVKEIIDLVVQKCGRSKRQYSRGKTVLGYSDSDPRNFRIGSRPLTMRCGMYIERII